MLRTVVLLFLLLAKCCVAQNNSLDDDFNPNTTNTSIVESSYSVENGVFCGASSEFWTDMFNIAPTDYRGTVSGESVSSNCTENFMYNPANTSVERIIDDPGFGWFCKVTLPDVIINDREAQGMCSGDCTGLQCCDAYCDSLEDCAGYSVSSPGPYEYFCFFFNAKSTGCGRVSTDDTDSKLLQGSRCYTKTVPTDVTSYDVIRWGLDDAPYANRTYATGDNVTVTVIDKFTAVGVLHNLYQFADANDFDTCNFTTAILLASIDDLISKNYTITVQAGPQYYGCSSATPGPHNHCKNHGMKINIIGVSPITSSPSTSSPSTSSPSTSSPSTSSPTTGAPTSAPSTGTEVEVEVYWGLGIGGSALLLLAGAAIGGRVYRARQEHKYQRIEEWKKGETRLRKQKYGGETTPKVSNNKAKRSEEWTKTQFA